MNLAHSLKAMKNVVRDDLDEISRLPTDEAIDARLNNSMFAGTLDSASLKNFQNDAEAANKVINQAAEQLLQTGQHFVDDGVKTPWGSRAFGLSGVQKVTDKMGGGPVDNISTASRNIQRDKSFLKTYSKQSNEAIKSKMNQVRQTTDEGTAKAMMEEVSSMRRKKAAADKEMLNANLDSAATQGKAYYNWALGRDADGVRDTNVSGGQVAGRIGATAGAWMGANTLMRGATGGSLGYNNEGERDIAGIWMI